MFYSLSVVVCSGMFFLLYNVFVSRKAGYTFCRRYLLVTMLLSIVIPSLNVPLYHKVVRADKPVAAVSTSNAVQAPEMVYLDAETQTHVSVPAAKQAAGESAVAASDAAQPAVAASVEASDPIRWNIVIAYVYAAGLLLCLGLIIRSVIYISGVRKRAILTREQGYTVAVNSEVTSPFSFLSTIFINKDYSDSERRQIMSHELSHIHHGHSIEKLGMSLIRSIFWFNPFMWLAEKSLEEVQEWQADNDALSDGYSIEDYRETIIKMLFGVSPLATTGMSASFTRKRLIRMKEKESTGHILAVSALTAVLASALFLCFGCKAVVEEGMVNDDDRVMEGVPDFMKTEGAYRKYLASDDRIFISVDGLIYADKGDKTPKHTRFEESYDGFDKLKRGIEFLEHPDWESFPTLICVNGYRCAEFPTSGELKWMNRNTKVIIGSGVATLDEFKNLKPEDYIGIIYYKPNTRRGKIPSLVCAITEESFRTSSNYNYASIINYPEADVPEIMNPGGFGLHGNYFICQDDYNIALTEHFAVDGKLVSLEEFREFYDGRRWRMPLVYRNSQAEKVFGQGITEVAELRSWSAQSARIQFSRINDIIVAMIDGREHQLSELANLPEILGVNADRPADAPRIYVEVFMDQSSFDWQNDELVETVRKYLPWNDPSLIINAFRKVNVESKPMPEYGFARVKSTKLVPVTQ